MKKTLRENYLDNIPVKNESLSSSEEEGVVTLEIENKGLFNHIAQKLFKKPKVSYVHLDELGSFIWKQIDGKRDVTAIAELVDEKFGEKAHPLYERLSQYISILNSYNFINLM
ncbi:MAG: PqqD family protein [Ruminococcaceae bacterium]|nr:PqqD family protein [Oscillospiraceae bacterium]